MATLEVMIQSEIADQRFDQGLIDSVTSSIKQAGAYDQLTFRFTGIGEQMRPGSFAHFARSVTQALANRMRSDFRVHLDPAHITSDWIRALTQVDALVVVECDRAFKAAPSGRFNEGATMSVGQLMQACALDMVAPPVARWTLGGATASSAIHYLVSDLKFRSLDPIFPNGMKDGLSEARIASVHEEVRSLVDLYAPSTVPRVSVSFIDAFIFDLLHRAKAPEIHTAHARVRPGGSLEVARTEPSLQPVGRGGKDSVNPWHLDAACADCAWAGHCRGRMSVDAHALDRFSTTSGTLWRSVFCSTLDFTYMTLTEQLIASGENSDAILRTLAVLRTKLLSN